MSILEIVLIAFGLAMDAFAVSVASGATLKTVSFRIALRFGVFFGLFQFIMPFVGWAVGVYFMDYLYAISHWIAFILLTVIGINMLIDALSSKNELADKKDKDILRWQNMTLLAIATSIDAMAIGVSLVLMGSMIVVSAIIIGIVAFVMSIIGVLIGRKLGLIFRKGAEITGAIVLIVIGLKVLIEHII